MNDQLKSYLKLCDRFLLDSENDQIFSANSDGRRALLDGFLSVLNLINNIQIIVILSLVKITQAILNPALLAPQ